MKKVFGVILIIVGVVCIPQVIGTGGADSTGALIGVSLVTFLPAYFLLRTNKTKDSKTANVSENHHTTISNVDSQKETFWENYKMKNLSIAFDIEELTGINFSTLSDKDAKEKVESLERWSKNTHVRIARLKDNFIETSTQNFSIDELKEGLDYMPQKQIEEANVFNISKQNTIQYWMIKWLKEYINNEENVYKSNKNLSDIEKILTKARNSDKSTESFVNSLSEDEMDSIIDFLADNDEESIKKMMSKYKK